jgi:ArsR family transcriptional regulator
MTIQALQLFKCLADETRLSCILLIHKEQELCVCELTHALQLSQPKISRHLAQLRECGLLKDRREGQWIFYSISPLLQDWVVEIISTTLNSTENVIKPIHQRLSCMGSRPERNKKCC